MMICRLCQKPIGSAKYNLFQLLGARDEMARSKGRLSHHEYEHRDRSCQPPVRIGIAKFAKDSDARKTAGMAVLAVIATNTQYTTRGRRIIELVRMGVEQPLLIWMLEQRLGFRVEL